MEREGGDAEALRRRLYRPGASPADLADYLRVAERPDAAPVEEDPARTEPPAGPSLRPFVIGGAVVAAAALLGAVLLTGGPRTPGTPPTAAASRAVVTLQAPAGDGRATFTVVSMFDGGEIDHARGAATQDGPDMVRYVVAQGDTATAVAGRFGLCTADVLQSLPYGFDPGGLTAGAMLELMHYDGNSC